MMNLRRLAIVCFEDPRHVSGGVQRRVAAEITYFANRGVNVTVITAGMGAHSRDGCVQYITIPTPEVLYPIRTLIFAARATHYLRGLPTFDVVETHHDAGAAALLSFERVPASRTVFVEVVHGVFRDEFSAVRRYERPFSRATFAASGLLPLSLIEQAAAKNACAVVTVSNYGAEQVSRRYGVACERIHVIPNGIDTDYYSPPADDPRLQNGCDHDAVCSLLYVGRWHARKGVLQLLRAFATAYGANRRLRLTFIGDGPLGPALRAEREQLGLAQAVEFLGAPDDQAVRDAYRTADVVCVPSLQEGQGIVALEAQACGAPIIATRAGGLTEAVQDGRTGMLVAPGDIDGMANAMLELVHNAPLRAEFGRNAAAWGRSFAWDTLLERSSTLYDRLSQPAVKA
ncbi:MAG: glycosyltransferase family 4 protein [Chloroflexota bacterium]|nr:glycosyltransferase family 4 protein [Chloroflexota bacterium]